MITYDLAGIYVPGLLVDALIAALLTLIAMQVMGRLGLYRHVWHPALFNCALFVVLLSLIAVPLGGWC